MTSTIQNPYSSTRLTEIIHTIEKLDEPYLSKIAEERETQVGQIQKYTETLLNQGWALRRKGERDGRKRIYIIKYREILIDYIEKLERYPEYDKLPEREQELVDGFRQDLINVFIDEIEEQETISEAASSAFLIKMPKL
jgi:DNA-binding MarR family transcriptional regulator